MANPMQQGIVPPPPGVVPNFANPAYKSDGVVPVTAVFLVLSTTFLLLRLYTKLRILKAFGVEDYIIIVAWVLNVMSSAIVLEQQNNGNGRHIWEITLAEYSRFAKWGDANVIIYIPAAGLAKVAILLFYLRINPDRTFRFVVFFVIFVTVGYMISLSLTLLFRCRPVDAAWDILITDKQCLNQSKLFLANAILNVITDFMVLAVPIPMLIALHVGWRQKLLIWSAFAAGSLTCIISIVRCYFVSTLVHSPDFTWTTQLSTVLTVVETNLTIICSAIMLLRPLLRQHFPSLFSSASKGVSYTSRQGRQMGAVKAKTANSDGSYTVFGDTLTGKTAKGKGSRRATEEGYILENLGTKGSRGVGYGLGRSGDRKARNNSDVTAVEGENIGNRAWFEGDSRGKSESKEKIIDKV